MILETTKPLILQIPGIISYDIYENQDALEVFLGHPKHYEANKIFEKCLADPAYMVLTHELKTSHYTISWRHKRDE